LSATAGEDAPDILLLDPASRPPTEVFGDKTQGRPYHLPLLAAALVVESRLPGAARVWGDFDRDQAEAARTWAEEVLGRPLSLPVAVDAPALHARLARFHEGDRLVAAFASLYLGQPDQVLAALGAEHGEPALRRWLLDRLAQHSSPAQPGALQLLAAWLNGARSLEELCVLCCQDPRGPRYEAEALVRALASLSIAIPAQEKHWLTVIDRPTGRPMTSDEQIAAVALDMCLPGWRLRRPLEQGRSRGPCQPPSARSASRTCWPPSSSRPARRGPGSPRCGSCWRPRGCRRTSRSRGQPRRSG